MITFKEYLEEHPTIGKRIIKAINPVEKIKDKMDKLKKRGGLTGIVKTKLKKQLDKVNPLSPLNKMSTNMKKDKIKNLSGKRKKLNIKSKILGTRILALRKDIKKP